MAIVKQNPNGHGSLKDIQLLINNNAKLIDNEIKKVFPELANDTIIWQSPLSSDNYSEYSDDDFISRVGLNKDEIKLNEFWPKRGPQWDALATTEKGRIILIEAKANIPEIVSPPSQASPDSMDLIKKSLNKAKSYLGIKNDIDWTAKFYQYTNRIAHLYFLRNDKKKPTYLVNVYFIGDTSVNGPKTKEEWKAALQVMYTYLGLKRHKLSKYMAEIFIDVNNLKIKLSNENR